MRHSSPLAALVRLLDGFSEWTGRLIAWLTLLMVVVTFVVVVMRYAFEMGNIALQESVIYMHSFVFLLGAAYTLKHDGHVRVDIIYRPLGEKGKAWINLFGTLFLLLPVCIFLFWVSWEYVATSWELKEGSQEAGGIAYRYILKTALLAMPAMMTLQGIAELLRSLLVISGHAHLPPPEGEHAL
ncbi:MAG: TRAP transporter small permease subunit [Oceanospirillales bacterium]|uniref:TRAP transporter small permease protein n=1 Tax=Marinobacterium halophilum TaxID=267374 RepID=A0A2P8EWN6_9GAMM|nr:TRAP transporter small permease subunit [Marinobacterium halophilum]MBR9828953.1 TRAP transporter small permease subunit [Oceanospirillales bacterium]PSL13880.1 TRAP-type mannitol/chloroaromatic compound transport system permease small subunit [Marinobacterium halophilum]